MKGGETKWHPQPSKYLGKVGIEAGAEVLRQVIDAVALIC